MDCPLADYTQEQQARTNKDGNSADICGLPSSGHIVTKLGRSTPELCWTSKLLNPRHPCPLFPPKQQSTSFFPSCMDLWKLNCRATIRQADTLSEGTSEHAHFQNDSSYILDPFLRLRICPCNPSLVMSTACAFTMRRKLTEDGLQPSINPTHGCCTVHCNIKATFCNSHHAVELHASTCDDLTERDQGG